MNIAVNSHFLTFNREHSGRAGNCQGCIKKTLCPVYEFDTAPQSGSEPGRVLQETVQPGQAVFNAGDAFEGIYIVRSGFFKSYSIDSDGVMQVTSFHFPGEVFGVEGIDTGHYIDNVEALDTASICRIPLALFSDTARSASTGTGNVSRLNELSRPDGGRMLTLVRLMSKSLARDRSMIFSLGKMCARRRFTTFLLDVSDRMARSGYDRDEFRLCMSRTDISNYLCLALETISRLFTQLQALGVIEVDRRNLAILDRQTLQALATDEHAGEALPEKRALVHKRIATLVTQRGKPCPRTALSAV